MTWQPPFRRQARRTARQVTPRLERFEGRVVPTVVVNGTAGNDLITSGFFYDSAAGSYRGEVRLNGAVVYSFLGDIYTSPTASIFLPEALEVNGLGGNDRIDLTALRDPDGQGTPIVVHGGPGNDRVVGSSGHDVLYGDAGADSLNGGIDEDTLVGDDADTAFIGGGGVDLLKFENFAGSLRATPDAITMNGNRLTAASGRFVQIAAFDVTGSNGADTIDLDQFPTFLANVRGRGGNDVIRVNAARGEVDGGNGDDLIVNTSTTPGGFSVLGGPGADTVRVNAGYTTVDAGPGDDAVDARGVPANGPNAGVNVTGGAGDDTVSGTTFADWLDGGDGDDQVSGGGGDDFLNGGPGADSITGGDDADTFQVDAADARWAGGRGSDTVYIDGGFRNAVVTNASVTLDGHAVAVSGLEVINISGTPLDDVLDASRFGGLVNLSGLDGGDVLRAGGGGSFLDGGGGDDQLFGGNGDDALYGGPGADRLSAGAGNDQLTADQFDTLVRAGSGTDYVGLTATGRNIVAADHSLTVDGETFPLADAEFVSYNLSGTSGNDTLDSTGYSQALSYSAGDGDDVVRTGPGDDTVDAGTGNDDVDAGAGNDVVTDIDGQNTLIGGPGNDSLTGGFGPDVLDGGADNDVLFGGYADVLLGGSGDDSIYTTTQAASVDAGAGYDLVSVQGAFSTNVVLTDTSWNDSGRVVSLLGVELFDMVTGIFDDTVDATAFSGYLSLNDSGGNNLVLAGSGGSGIYLRGNPLFDFMYSSTVVGGSGSDTIYADTGHNFFYGNGGDDYLSVAFGGSYLDGGAGNDTLSGGDGDDTLLGGIGDDDLRGNAGTDSVVGGTGADRFTRDTDPVVAAAEAVLWDYNPGEGDEAVDPN